ncbi:MAG: LysM domain-containing protein [Patescibacteria group bacterium]|nr:LysM domain-containing protein [Patescibacteria group bacterium]
MKKFVLIILVAMAVSALAQAEETYMVKANETLAQIAKKYGLTWQQILAANPEISDPTLLRTGQELRIPEVPEAGVFLWKNPGGDPFGKRDFRKAIKMFSLPGSVKAFLIARVERGDSEDYYLAKGERFCQMVFNNYRLVNNVVAAWPDSTVYYEAKRYSCQVGDSVYYLIAPTICNNWAWWKEKIPDKPVFKKPDKPKEPKLETKKPPASPPSLVPPEKKDESVFVRRHETYLWAGHYFPLQGAGGSNYYGGKSNFYFSTKGAFLTNIHFGIGGIANGWQGKTGSGFSYDGYRATVGPVLDMTMKNYRFTSSLQLGRQHDQGRDGKGYKAEQDDSILYFGLTADSYGNGAEIFKERRFETWLDFIFDVGHSKKSWWANSRIPRRNDPAGNKGSVNFGSRYYLWDLDGFKSGIVAKSSYAYEDYGITSIVGFCIGSKEDIFKFGVEFKNTRNSKFRDANGNSIGVTLDFEPQKKFFR